jgi:hypothetical protein
MGTNYYRIPTEKEIEDKRRKIISKIESWDITPFSIIMGIKEPNDISFDWNSPWDDFLEETNIHLGKRSGGWKFCWNFHDNKFYSNKEQLLEFIRGGRVVNEYGDEQEVEEFIQMALDWCQPDGLIVNEEYENSRIMRYPDSIFYGSKYWDKEIDGLRVSSSIDFC